jgi:hypothetical protein
MNYILLIIFIILIFLINRNYRIKNYRKNIAIVNSDKGRSVIATENISSSTLILVDNITFHSNDYFEIIYNILNSNDRELKDKYFNLSPDNIDNTFITKQYIENELNNSNYKDYFKNVNIDLLILLIEKLSRNVFLFNEDSNIEEYGLFIDSIYFNHSCSPNVIYKIFNNKIYFYTLRDIKKGEELYITYIDPTEDRKKRKEKLFTTYGFICNCELCSI